MFYEKPGHSIRTWGNFNRYTVERLKSCPSRLGKTLNSESKVAIVCFYYQGAGRKPAHDEL